MSAINGVFSSFLSVCLYALNPRFEVAPVLQVPWQNEQNTAPGRARKEGIVRFLPAPGDMLGFSNLLKDAPAGNREFCVNTMGFGLSWTPRSVWEGVSRKV